MVFEKLKERLKKEPEYYETGNKCPQCGGNELNWGSVDEYFCDDCDYFNNCPNTDNKGYLNMKTKKLSEHEQLLLQLQIIAATLNKILEKLNEPSAI